MEINLELGKWLLDIIKNKYLERNLLWQQLQFVHIYAW